MILVGSFETDSRNVLFSEDFRAKVVNLYSQGNTTKHEVAETFDVSLGFVHSAVARH